MEGSLYRIVGNSWAYHVPKAELIEQQPIEVLNKREGGCISRPREDQWEIHIEADNYGTAKVAANVLAEAIHELGMPLIENNGIEFAVDREGFTSVYIQVAPIKQSWSEWGWSFIPFFATLGNPHLRKFKVVAKPLDGDGLIVDPSWSAYARSWIRTNEQARLAIENLRRVQPPVLLPITRDYDVANSLQSRLEMEPFSDPWTAVSARVFQERTRYFYPQKGLRSDYRLVIRNGVVEAVPITPHDDKKENKAAVRAFFADVLEEYDMDLGDGSTVIQSIQYEYGFNLAEMIETGAPLTPEHVYRLNIGVNQVSVQRIQSLYERLYGLMDFMDDRLASQSLDFNERIDAFLMSCPSDWKGQALKLNISEIRNLHGLLSRTYSGQERSVETFYNLLHHLLIPDKRFTAEPLSESEKGERLSRFYEIRPEEEAHPLNPEKESEPRDVVASHFNKSIFSRNGLGEKVLQGRNYSVGEYSARKLSPEQFHQLMQILQVPDDSRHRIYTGREIRHTPIMGFMTVDDPADDRKLFKPYQSQQEELQIYFDQRSPEHFENWVELCCHVTCKTDRTHRFNSDPNDLRVGDLIPAPDTWDGMQRWYVVEAVVDDNGGDFNYWLQPVCRSYQLPAVKLYRSTASDLHANNGLASVQADLTGHAPGASNRDLADEYEDPFFIVRTMPQEVGQWLSIQKRLVLQQAIEQYVIRAGLDLSEQEQESFWADLEAGIYDRSICLDEHEGLQAFYKRVSYAYKSGDLEELWEQTLGYEPVSDNLTTYWNSQLDTWQRVLSDLQEAYHNLIEKKMVEYADNQEAIHHLEKKKEACDLSFLLNVVLPEGEVVEEHVPFLSQTLHDLREEATLLKSLFSELADTFGELPHHKIHDDLLFAGHSLGGGQAQGGMWHFLFNKGRIPLPGCYAYCYANDSPKVTKGDNQGFLSCGSNLSDVLVSNGIRFHIYHKEDGRGDPVPESGDQHLGTSPYGGDPFRSWLKVVINVFRELPTTSIPEITLCSAHGGRTGKALADLRRGQQPPSKPDVAYTVLSQADLWRFDHALYLSSDLRAVFDYRLLLSPVMTEGIRRTIGKGVGLGVRVVKWWKPELQRGHRDEKGAMYIGLGKDQFATHAFQPKVEHKKSELALRLQKGLSQQIIDGQERLRGKLFV